MGIVDLDQCPRQSVVIGPLRVVPCFFSEIGDAVEPHDHALPHVTFVQRGRFRITVGGEVAEMGPATARLIPARVKHGMVALEADSLLMCVFVDSGSPEGIF